MTKVDELKWDFTVGDRKECVVCHEKKSGVQMKLGYTSGDFVCKDCIRKYMSAVEAELRDKVGENGELFTRLDEEGDRIERINDYANADYTSPVEIFDKLGEIYSTIFPNGITSGSPTVVGQIDGNDVKVGGSGVGIVSGWRTVARYPKKSKQVRMASQLWRKILPEISNYQDRNEKFKKLFKAFDKACAEFDFNPYGSNRKSFEHKTEFNELLKYGKKKGKAITISKSSYSKAKPYLDKSSIPLSPPNSDVWDWLDLLPKIEKAYENAREEHKKKEKAQKKVIDRVEKAVQPWYVANSIDI